MSEPTVVMGLTSVDAVRQDDPETGHVTLLLSANQSFDSAFTHARRLLPQLHPDVLRRLVRSKMPEAAQMIEKAPTPLGNAQERTDAQARRTRVVWWNKRRAGLFVGFVSAVAVAAGGLSPTFIFKPPNSLDRPPPPGTARVPVEGRELWTGPLFDKVKYPHAALRCVPATTANNNAQMTARCVAPDGIVMHAQVTVSQVATTYLLSYGADRMGIIDYGNSEAADLAGRELSAPGFFPNAHVVGRYLLFGTGHGRIDEHIAKAGIPHHLAAIHQHEAVGFQSPAPGGG